MRVLTAKGLSHELRKLADRVRRDMWIASPYVGTWDKVSRILGVRWLQKDITVRLLTDTSGNSCDLNREALRHFDGNVKHIAGLHAKVYIIDNSALITSANLTGKAFSQRVEIGILLTGDEARHVISMYEDWWENMASPVLADWVPTDCGTGTYQEEPSGKGLPIRTPLPPAPQMPKAVPRSPNWVKPPVVGLLEGLLPKSENDRSLKFFLRRQKNINFAIVGEERPYHDAAPAGDEQPLRLTFYDGRSVKITALLKAYASDELRMKWHQRLEALGFRLGGGKTRKAQQHPAIRIEQIDTEILKTQINQDAIRNLFAESIRAWRRSGA